MLRSIFQRTVSTALHSFRSRASGFVSTASFRAVEARLHGTRPAPLPACSIPHLSASHTEKPQKLRPRPVFLAKAKAAGSRPAPARPGVPLRPPPRAPARARLPPFPGPGCRPQRSLPTRSATHKLPQPSQRPDPLTVCAGCCVCHPPGGAAKRAAPWAACTATARGCRPPPSPTAARRRAGSSASRATSATRSASCPRRA